MPYRLNHIRRFNTQPPEGGWRALLDVDRMNTGFNTQPPEGGWWVWVYWVWA